MATINTLTTPPAGIVDTSGDYRKPIDSLERLNAQSVRVIEKMNTYLSFQAKQSSPCWCGAYQLAKGTDVDFFFRVPITAYTKNALLVFIYGSESTSTNGVLKGEVEAVTDTAPATPFTHLMNAANSRAIRDATIVQEIIEVGAGSKGDMGFEQVTVNFNNTSSGNLILDYWIMCVGIFPMPVASGVAT